jgi:hypothetical protein
VSGQDDDSTSWVNNIFNIQSPAGRNGYNSNQPANRYVWQFFKCVWFVTMSMLMSKTMWMSIYDDIMWMSNYKDFMCDGWWNYMLMPNTCCNVFVNVSWCLRMWIRIWIDVCECNCECEYVVVIVYMNSMYIWNVCFSVNVRNGQKIGVFLAPTQKYYVWWLY